MNVGKRQSGMTLVEVILAIALLVIVVFVVLKFFRFRAQSMKYVKNTSEKWDIDQYLVNSISCENTFTAAVRTTCAGGGNPTVEVKGHTNNVLINTAGSNAIGGVQLRARCGYLNPIYTLDIEGLRVVNGQPARDPYTKKPAVWTKLGGKVPFACP